MPNSLKIILGTLASMLLSFAIILYAPISNESPLPLRMFFWVCGMTAIFGFIPLAFGVLVGLKELLFQLPKPKTSPADDQDIESRKKAELDAGIAKNVSIIAIGIGLLLLFIFAMMVIALWPALMGI